METKLDRLLASIDPDRTLVATEKAVDRAINTFNEAPVTDSAASRVKLP